MKNLIKGLYCILPEFDTIEKYKKFVSKLIKFNPNIIQLRIKNKSDQFFYQVAFEIKKILSSKNICFIIDDRVDIALLIKSHGVHLGQDDLSALEVRKLVNNLGLKKFIIGYSTHSLEQAKKALYFPVDYISVGPVFKTNTKPEYIPVGVNTLKKVKEFVKDKFPIVAVGGINSKNIDLIKKIGVDAVAVVSAIKDLNPDVIERLKF
ncbi:MAG: thiamine phosphate synthase [Endomicrobiia bacterium]